MKTLEKSVSIAVVFFLVGCTYETDEVYYKEVVQPQYTASISLNEFPDGDTLVLWGPTDFTFGVDITPGIIQRVSVFFNRNEILQTAGPNGGFRIGATASGLFELKIEFIAKSATGSYADRLNAEKVQSWRIWYVRIDVDPPPRAKISLTNENGFLKASWPPYEKPNFVRYRLIASPAYGNSKFVIITDPYQTTWIDSTYSGDQPISVSVETVAYGSSTGVIEYEKPLDAWVQYNASDSTATLSWTKIPFTGAFKSYEVFNEGYMPAITDPEDTVLTLKLDVIWNKPMTVSVQYNSKYSQFTPTIVKRITKTVALPRLNIDPSKLYFNATLNSFVGSRNGHLVMFNTALEPIDSLPAVDQYAVPFFGTFVYYRENNAVVQHNVETGETKKHYVLNTHGVPVIPLNLSASANGIISYHFVQSGWHSRVYSFDDNAFIEKLATANPDRPNPVLSDDGQYGYYPATALLKLMKLTGVEPVGKVSWGFNCIRQDVPNEIILQGDVYDAATLTLKRDIVTPGSSLYSDYDPYSRRVAFGGNHIFYFVDIDTFETLAMRAYQLDDDGTSIRYRLVGGYIFDEKGYYVKVF